MNRRRLLGYTAASAIGCVMFPRAATGTTSALRVASNFGEPYSEAAFANELGYFRSLDLDVDLSIIGQGGTMAAAVAAGNLDIAIATPVQVASAFSRNVPFTIIAAGAVSTLKAPVTPVVVAKDSVLRQPHDLAGKTVALNGLRASSELALDAWLAQNNVDVTQIHQRRGHNMPTPYEYPICSRC